MKFNLIIIFFLLSYALSADEDPFSIDDTIQGQLNKRFVGEKIGLNDINRTKFTIFESYNDPIYLNLVFSYYPKPGSRSILECIMRKEHNSPIPFLASFRIGLNENISESTEVVDFIMNKDMGLIKDPIYEISTPFNRFPEILNLNTFACRIHHDLFDEFLSGHKKAEPIEVYLFFEEVECSMDGKRLGYQFRTVGPIQLCYQESEGWMVVDKSVDIK